jgi:hydrogenase-4 component E
LAQVVDASLVLVLLVNFFMLGTSRMRSIINSSRCQGIALSFLTPFVHHSFVWQSLVIAFGAMLFKGWLIPRMLFQAMRDVDIPKEVEPLIGFVPSLLLGAFGTGLAVIFAHTLPLAPQHADSLLIPTSLSTVLTGLILLTSRRKAITQVVGYLILENGVFIMGLTLVHAMPFMVEMGVLLDLIVGIFVMGITINHIQREFSSLDTTQLSQLKE